MMGKGQYFSFDAIVAAVIFIISIAMLSAYWFGVYSVIDSQDDSMLRDALRMSDAFVTPGTPNDWQALGSANLWDGVNERSNVHQLGFTTGYEGNDLNDTKLKVFSDFVNAGELNYNRSKSMLRTEYEYYVNVTYYNPATAVELTLYEFGKNPLVYGANNTVRVDRAGSLNITQAGDERRPVSMHIMLWTGKRRT